MPNWLLYVALAGGAYLAFFRGGKPVTTANVLSPESKPGQKIAPPVGTENVRATTPGASPVGNQTAIVVPQQQSASSFGEKTNMSTRSSGTPPFADAAKQSTNTAVGAQSTTTAVSKSAISDSGKKVIAADESKPLSGKCPTGYIYAAADKDSAAKAQGRNVNYCLKR